MLKAVLFSVQHNRRCRSRLAVDWANLLCVTDQPKQTGNAFGRRCLEDWQLLHGPLPPLLQRYLLAGGWQVFWHVRCVTAAPLLLCGSRHRSSCVADCHCKCPSSPLAALQTRATGS